MKKIYNFESFPPFDKKLEGTNFEFSLNESNLSKVEKDAEIITVGSQSRITKKVLDYFPKLKLIVARCVGTDKIDLEECKNQDIAVYNIPDYGSLDVAEHAFALLLSKTRKVIELNEKLKEGIFTRRGAKGIGLQKKIIGLVGAGRIGKEMAKLAKAFNMKILAYDIFKDKEAAEEIGFEYVSFEKLLSDSDIISLHVPLNENTKHMIDEKAIEKMKDNIILINVSRGGVINTQDLINNLNKFKYVCLDVVENEENPRKYRKLLNSKKVVMTPHIAFFTDETVKEIVRKTKENIRNFKKRISKNKVV